MSALRRVRRWGLALVAGGLTVAAAAAGFSGIDRQELDPSVRPQDDFYQYVNGKWLAATVIPPDRASFGPFEALQEQSLTELRQIAESLESRADPADADQRKIADLYASFMDEATLEQRGLRPLAEDFVSIDALRTKADVAALMAHFNRLGVPAPFTPEVHQDARIPRATSSIWARMASGFPTATTTCRTTASSDRSAPVTSGTSRACWAWLATRVPPETRATLLPSRPRWPVCSGPAYRIAIPSRPITAWSSPGWRHWHRAMPGGITWPRPESQAEWITW
jgi:hypothetical protein